MNSKAFEPLRRPDYRWLWFGQLISVVGDKLNQIAVAVLVYAMTGSMLQIGIMLGLTALPAVLFGVVAGTYVDRWGRRRTMIVADLIRAVLVLLIPICARASIWYVYAIGFLIATVALFFEPAKRALIPELVDDSEVMSANSLDQASASASELAGLAAGGVLVAALGTNIAFALDAVTFLASAIAIAAIAHRETPANTETRQSIVGEAVEGLRHIGGSPVLRDLTLVYTVAVIGGSASIPLCYALALRTYDAGPHGLALLDGAITVGLLLGAFMVGSSGPDAVGRKLLLGLLGMGVTLALIPFATTIWLAVPVLLVAGFANMWVYIPAITLFQKEPPPRFRGRVTAAAMTIVRVFTVAGMIGAGALLQHTGTSPVALGASAILVAAALLGFTRPALRNA
ncbi:MAG: MFS transporter [Coriobacteriia bacterium]|nr:MFS transporter [Coriobacteriia bacterium]